MNPSDGKLEVVDTEYKATLVEVEEPCTYELVASNAHDVEAAPADVSVSVMTSHWQSPALSKVK